MDQTLFTPHTVKVVSCTLSALLCVGAVFICAGNYRSCEDGMARKASMVAARVALNAAAPMWEMDAVRVGRTLDAELADHDVKAIVVTEREGEALKPFVSKGSRWLEQNQSNSGLFFRATAPIEKDYKEIGSAEIYLSRAGFEFDLLQSNIQVVALAVLSLILLFIVTRRVTKAEETPGVIRSAMSSTESLLTNASYEIRTILNNIMGVIQMLLERPLAAEDEELVHDLKSSVSALMTVFNLGSAGIVSAAVSQPRRDGSKEIRVLLAEDNRITHKLTKSILQSRGLQVCSALDGKQALEHYQQSPQGFDVILMDCQMPLMDGYETAIKIRSLEEKTGRRVPIVAMTAHSLQGDREKCVDAGMDDYLPKPFTAADLFAAIERWASRASEPPAE